MTYTKKQVLPALHKSNKVNNPDMPSVEDKNYTATILKYANLALPFPQLDTDAKTVVAAINELYAHPGGSIVIPNPPIGEDGIELEQGGYIELEQGGVLGTEQGGGGGTVVGPLNAISIDGDIYTIEGGGGTTIKTVEMILTVNGWNASTLKQSLPIYDLTSTSTVLVAPTPDDTAYDTFIQCGIRAVSQTTGALTFQCKNIPDVNVSITISYWKNF